MAGWTLRVPSWGRGSWGNWGRCGVGPAYLQNQKCLQVSYVVGNILANAVTVCKLPSLLLFGVRTSLHRDLHSVISAAAAAGVMG